MPTYEYRCDSCGHQFELMQPVGGNRNQRCEACGKRARRLFSPVGIIFRGSGWHITDYGRKGNGGDGKGPKERREKGEGIGDVLKKTEEKSKSVES